MEKKYLVDYTVTLNCSEIVFAEDEREAAKMAGEKQMKRADFITGGVKVNSVKEFEVNEARTLNKIVLVYPASTAFTLIQNLGAGEPTVNGDRTSGYINIATEMGRKKYVKATLIEEKNGLPPEDQGYALHIINDIDGTDGVIVRTDRLDEDDLEALLGKILEDLEEGRI